MLKFLTDECVGVILARWLRSQGYDVVAITEANRGFKDDLILQQSFLNDRVLITLDSDFGEIIFRQKAQHAGVIFLKLENEHPSKQIMVMERILKTHSPDLPGNFIVATEWSIRVVRRIVEAQA